jgi:hypothetical protein
MRAMTSVRFLSLAAAALSVSCAAVSSSPDVPISDVAFEIGDSDFPYGDFVTIDDVRSSNGTLDPGAIVAVSGRYALRSRESARLYLGTTTNGPVGGVVKVADTQSMLVQKGEGTYTLAYVVPALGNPHVTLYDVVDGGPFAGVYFGVGSSVLRSGKLDYSR